MKINKIFGFVLILLVFSSFVYASEGQCLCKGMKCDTYIGDSLVTQGCEDTIEASGNAVFSIYDPSISGEIVDYGREGKGSEYGTYQDYIGEGQLDILISSKAEDGSRRFRAKFEGKTVPPANYEGDPELMTSDWDCNFDQGFDEKNYVKVTGSCTVCTKDIWYPAPDYKPTKRDYCYGSYAPVMRTWGFLDQTEVTGNIVLVSPYGGRGPKPYHLFDFRVPVLNRFEEEEEEELEECPAYCFADSGTVSKGLVTGGSGTSSGEISEECKPCVDTCGDYCSKTIPGSKTEKKDGYCNCLCDEGYKLAVNGEVIEEEELSVEQMRAELEKERELMFHPGVLIDDIHLETVKNPDKLIIAGIRDKNLRGVRDLLIENLYKLPPEVRKSLRGIIINSEEEYSRGYGGGAAQAGNDRIIKLKILDSLQQNDDLFRKRLNYGTFRHEASHTLTFQHDANYRYNVATAKHQITKIVYTYITEKATVMDKLGIKEDNRLREIARTSDKLSYDEKESFLKAHDDYDKIQQYKVGFREPVDEISDSIRMNINTFIEMIGEEEYYSKKDIFGAIFYTGYDYFDEYYLSDYILDEHSEKTGEYKTSFMKEWEEIAGDVYTGKVERVQSGNSKGKIKWQNLNDELSEFELTRPMYGIMEPYGSFILLEDISTFTEAFISHEKMILLKQLIDPNSAYYGDMPNKDAVRNWAEIYKKKLELALKYGFITQEEYDFVTGELSCIKVT